MDDDELKAKVREFFEMLFERQKPEDRVISVEHFSNEADNRIEKEMRDFYAAYGRWPVFQRGSDGTVVMETKEEVDGETNNRDTGAADDR